MFDEVEKLSFPEQEEQTLEFWKAKRIFEQSVEQRSDAPLFSFYDGPPFATGLPHYGHLLAGTIKDVVPRYKTMKGFQVPRRFGWDCHGLPVESEIEKQHGLSGAASIEEYGIARFNEECRSIVLRYTSEWQATVERMARWVSFEDTYHTMDLTFMESVWWVFKQLFDKGYVYEGYKVMPFSARLGTPLSNFEATQNYKEVDDPSLVVKFALLDEPQTYFLAWTTTPWTLISNLACTVGPDVDYVQIKEKASGDQYILARARLTDQFKDAEAYTVEKEMKGKDLAGIRYEPLFPYFKDRAEEGAFKIIQDAFVETDEGTGIVHTAPAFGEADFYACKEEGIDPVCPVDANGRFTEEVPDYAGMGVKEADKEIIRRLKEEGKVHYHGTIRHRYPFCWRTDTPLIYRVMTTWFVKVEEMHDRLLANNEQIHWMPSHIKHGRFGKWLEGARDWAISRNRYWGTPIPLWRSEDGEVVAVGSIAELEELTGETITDLHRHNIDHLTFVKDGKEFKRVTEVFDCWFESGSMPYAQNHYPFENKEAVEKGFPADFIAEGLDQTRGWFYTLTVLSTALFDTPAFKNVIVNGIILAEDGSKMSKRLKNYPEPSVVINKYGADAIRLYMLHSPAVRGDDLAFSERGIELVLRQILIPWWNAYSFLVTYARINEWQPHLMTKKPSAVIDQWMISRLHALIHDVEQGMDDYDLNRAVEPFVGFIDELTNWYIRRCRRRFWAEEASQDRDEAFATLYTVLLELSKVAAPFVPFVTDAIYRNLKPEGAPESVHLCEYPEYRSDLRDVDLEETMTLVQQAVSLGHALRKEHKLKVRQPLPAAHLATGDERIRSFLEDQQYLIADELNVKQVIFESDEGRFVSLKAKPNFRVLGKKVGKKMPLLQKAVGAFSREQLQSLASGETLSVDLDGESVDLTSDDVEVVREVRDGMIAANEGLITIALDTALTPELELEGLSRELVNKINTMRRDAGLEVTDRITVQIQSTDRVKQSFEQYQEYICGEVLCTGYSFAEANGTEWDLNGEPATIAIQKAERVQG